MCDRSQVAGLRDWAHLPSVAVQCLGRHCCPASTAKLRAVCRTWHDALTRQFGELFIGPSSPWPDLQRQPQSAGTASAPVPSYDAIARSFPAAHTLHVTASSTRDYSATYTEDLAQLFCNTPSLVNLSLQELHELEDFDNLDTASLWDALHAAAAVPGGLAGRLLSLRVSDCFWNTPELFCVLKQLTGLIQLRLLNNPLETACEVNIIASLTQLKVLKFGLIFDGSSQHHDVPRALEQVSNLTCLQELSIPMWRRSLGGRAHPLAPSLAVVLGKLTGLTSLAVDGKFGHLTVVSCLTNLRRLASAAPLSMEGWQAIAQLPHLTLLTSLTPAAEPLRLNPARPHAGLDLGMLATRGCLNGLDVAVMQPEHLATLGQFTALQRLNLRCASTFQQTQQQAQLLTALSCLPSSLTSLTLGPLLPLSATLLTNIARSCADLKALSARFTYVTAVGSSMGPVEAQQLELSRPEGLDSHILSFPDTAATMELSEDLHGLAAGSDTGITSSSSSVSGALQQLQALTSLELVLLSDEDAADDQHAYGTSGGGGSSSRPHSSAGTAAAAVVRGPQTLASSSASGSMPCVQLALEDLPKGLKELVLAGPWQLGLRASEGVSGGADAGNGQHSQQRQQPCAVCGLSPGLSMDVEPAHNTSVKLLCHCMTGLDVDSNPNQIQQAASAPDSPTKQAASGHKRPGSYSSRLTAQAAASIAPDVFVLEGQGLLEKRSRSFDSFGRSTAAANEAAVGKAALRKATQQQGRSASFSSNLEVTLQQQQAVLPALLQLCLYRCHIPYEALVQLISAGSRLQKLQLLQLHTNQLQPPMPAAAVLSPRAVPAAAAARAARLSGSGSSSCYRVQDPTVMTTEQLLQLPVAWSHLEEWHLLSHHLWGLTKGGGCCSGVSSSAVQQGSGNTGHLQHLSQLLNLRHLYVVNRPTSFTTAQPIAKDHSQGEAATALPLHNRPAVESLLLQLQQGLQQMPALRQLLLYMGHVTKQQPDLPDDCQEIWAEAGERLLEGMPACRVKLYSPVVSSSCSYLLPDRSNYLVHGVPEKASHAAVLGGGLGVGQAVSSGLGAAVAGEGDSCMMVDGSHVAGPSDGVVQATNLGSDLQGGYIEDYVI